MLIHKENPGQEQTDIQTLNIQTPHLVKHLHSHQFVDPLTRSKWKKHPSIWLSRIFLPIFLKILTPSLNGTALGAFKHFLS